MGPLAAVTRLGIAKQTTAERRSKKKRHLDRCTSFSWEPRVPSAWSDTPIGSAARSILNRFNDQVSHYFGQKRSLHGNLRRRNASLLYPVEQEQPGKSVRATLVVVTWTQPKETMS